MRLNKTLKVEGLVCAACEQAVHKAILKVDSTARVQYDREHSMLAVTTSHTMEAIITAIREAGFKASHG